MRSFCLCAAVAAILGWGAAFAQAGAPKEFQGLPLVFEERFAQGAERWSPTDPAAWKVVDDAGKKAYALFRASKYEPPVRSPKGISLIKDVVVGDFVVEAKIRQTGIEYPHRDTCIFFGYQDPTHFYYAHLGSKADDTSHAIHIVNGAPRASIVKERTNGVAWGKDYHTVRVVRKVETGAIEVYFDDMTKPVMTAEDKTFDKGQIGFGSFDDTGNFTDIAIWGIKK